MSKTLEQETSEEFETKYNLIFENPSAEDKGESCKSDDEHGQECTSLVTIKERRLMAAQNMFKKSIRISLKSFLISLSLSFLNLFM